MNVSFLQVKSHVMYILFLFYLIFCCLFDSSLNNFYIHLKFTFSAWNIIIWLLSENHLKYFWKSLIDYYISNFSVQFYILAFWVLFNSYLFYWILFEHLTLLKNLKLFLGHCSSCCILLYDLLLLEIYATGCLVRFFQWPSIYL